MDIGALGWIVLLLAACAGGLIFRRLGVTAGAMVGAMITVAAMQLIFGESEFPVWMRRAMQVLSGAMIGSRILRRDVAALRHLVRPLLILLPGLMTVNLLLGFSVARLSELSPATAFFGSAPGGVSDISLIAADLGADAGMVSIMQLTRLFGIVLIFPPLFRRMGSAQAAAQSEEAIALAAVPKPPLPLLLRRNLLTLLTALAGGVAFFLLGVPAGAMVGAMLFTAVLSVCTGRARFPSSARLPLQLASGAYIGSMITREQFFALGEFALPVVLILAGLFVCSFGIGYLLHKVGGLDMRTALLSSTPGGLQEMSLLAEELSCNSATVTILQTMRLFCVVLLFPPLLRLVIPLL